MLGAESRQFCACGRLRRPDQRRLPGILIQLEAGIGTSRRLSRLAHVLIRGFDGRDHRARQARIAAPCRTTAMRPVSTRPPPNFAMTSNAPASLRIACPQCGKEHQYDRQNPWRPFCSERCKQIDLGAWANEEYRVPGGEAGDDLNADESIDRPS